MRIGVAWRSVLLVPLLKLEIINRIKDMCVFYWCFLSCLLQSLMHSIHFIASLSSVVKAIYSRLLWRARVNYFSLLVDGFYECWWLKNYQLLLVYCLLKISTVGKESEI